MNETILLRNIMLELQYVPAEYLRLLFELIHAFRLNLPTATPVENPQEEIDWEEILMEIMENRRRNHEAMFRKVDTLFTNEA